MRTLGQLNVHMQSHRNKVGMMYWGWSNVVFLKRKEVWEDPEKDTEKVDQVSHNP
jgi:hypothetical protein